LHDPITPALITRKEAKAKGLNRYYTGQPCKKAGHNAERRTINGACVDCNRARAKPMAKLAHRRRRLRLRLEREAAAAAAQASQGGAAPCPE